MTNCQTLQMVGITFMIIFKRETMFINQFSLMFFFRERVLTATAEEVSNKDYFYGQKA